MFKKNEKGGKFLLKMARMWGAKDRRKRKTRSDKGKKRKRYAKKPVKKKRKRYGKFVPYIPPREKKQNLKIWFWSIETMSKEGYKRLPTILKKNYRRIVYKPGTRVNISVDRLRNKMAVEQLCEELAGMGLLKEGLHLMKGFSRGKNKRRIKNVSLAKIRIWVSSEGVKAKMTENIRLYRYWFWRG